MNRYKSCALFGTIIMGIASFTACLAETRTYASIGNILLVISIFIMVYGYSKWQP